MTNTAGYYRFPTLMGDRVVFACEDDLWTVPAGGGVARRLSAGPGTLSRSALSPDGTLLAYTGRDEGPDEVWVMPSDGGPSTRLTWLGAMTYVVGFKPDGKSVVFATDDGQPFAAHFHLFEVPVTGGPTRPLVPGPATTWSPQPGGRGVVIGRNLLDLARWKRYRGGTAGTLWIDGNGRGEFRPLVVLPGNLACPMWIGDRVYFLSDHEGHGNLYSVTPAGGDLAKHTDHRDYYVRFPQTDGQRIVYSAGANLHLFDVAADESHPLPVEVRSARPDRNRKFVDAARHLEAAALHPQGHSVAVTTRGKVFSLPLFEGAVTARADADGVRHRLASFLPDGRRLLAVSDESGEEELVILGAEGEREPIPLALDIGRTVDLAVCPVEPLRAALTNHRYELVVVDLAKKTAKVVDRSRHERIQGPAWSPDGRWLAYSIATGFTTRGIRLWSAQNGRTHEATRPDFKDFSPSFDPDGKHLWFVSYREYDPVYDRHHFDLGFPRGGRLMALPLTADLPSPFEMKPRAPGAAEPASEALAKKGAKAKAPEKHRVKIDLPGLPDRVLAFPLPEGNYGRIEGIRGKVLFTSYPVEGALSQPPVPAGPAANATLESFDLRDAKRETLLGGVSDFTLSADGKVMAVRCGRRLRVLPAGAKPEAGSEHKEPGRESGFVDLSRVRLSVVPGLEWAQMFREAWRLQRDHFWRNDMSGLDWSAVYERYRPLVDRVAVRSELSDLLWELQGELGTSHAYEFGGDYRGEPEWHVGHLGADLRYDEKSGAWVVARIPRGDSWREDSSSPLAAPGLAIGPGTRILAVAGKALDPRHGPRAALVHQAGQRVELRVAAPGGKPRTVTVKAMPSERALRYRDWVEGNRALVHRLTKDRVGYVHVPNMGPQGFAEFHRYFLAELYRDGLLIDVRFNGGGHVSCLLLEKLLRRRVGWDVQRWGEALPYPYEAPAGPMVALTNERAGSDGDIFSHAFKLYRLGPLIGRRTWGGVVGIWPRHALVDGTVTTQPEFSFWFEDVGFAVENYGTDPDIDVENLPQDYAKGRDAQLTRGIEEMLRLLKERPPAPPPAK